MQGINADLSHDKTFLKISVDLASSLGSLCSFLKQQETVCVRIFGGGGKIEETNHDSPSSNFIMTTREEVMKVESFVAISDDFWQSTRSNNTSQWKLTGNLCEQ